MKKIIDFVYNISCRVCFCLVSIVCIYMFLNSIFSTSLMRYEDEHTYFVKDFPLLMIMGLFFMIGLLFLGKKYLSKYVTKYKDKKVVRRWRCIVTGLWLVLMLFWVLPADVEMVYDQKTVYESIRQFLQGDFKEWQVGGYFSNYPLQNGLLFIFMPIVKFFGEYSYEAVQGINIFCIWAIAYGCYKLAGKYFDGLIAFFSYTGILMFVPLWGYVKYFYGNLIGLSLIISSIYWLVCYLETTKKRYFIGSMGFALLSVVCKSNFSIFIIAMVIVLVLQGLQRKEIRFGVAGILLILCMLAGMYGPAKAVHMITGCVTDGGVPTIKWIEMGLTESSTAPGWYSGDPFGWFAENNYSVSMAKESAYERIGEAVEIFKGDKWYACRFFARKFASIWNNPTFESFAIVIKGNTEGTLPYWIKDALYNGGLINGALTLLLDIWQSVYLFGMILYLLFCKKGKKLEHAIPLIAFLGGVLFHMFWEGKCQYTVIYIPLLYPYVFGGYRACIKGIEDRLAHRKDAGLTWGKVWKEIWGNAGIKKLFVILLLIIVIGLSNHELFSSTIKLQADTRAYVGYCREATDWKSDDFVK